VLTASGGTGYLWSNGAITPSIIVNASGNYAVTGTNANGCINSTSQVVTVNPLPAPTVTGDTVVCSGSSGNIYIADAGFTGYTWNITSGGILESGAGTNQISVNWITPGGVESVTAEYANAYGCLGSKTIQVSVTPLPPSTRNLESVIIPNGQTLCSDATDTLIVPAAGNIFQLQTGGSAILISGHTIRIIPGAVVAAGGYLHGYISSDCFYCNAVPHTLPQALKDETEAGISETGIAATDNAGLFRVYPNPTTGTFTLELTSRENLSGTVEIYGIRGEKLLTQVLKGERMHEFSLHDKPNGMYIIRVVTEGVSGTSRVIKY
jgi:hypothetical protein